LLDTRKNSASLASRPTSPSPQTQLALALALPQLSFDLPSTARNGQRLLKPSLNWLLVFVPVAVVLRLWPRFGNETALFVCSCLAVVPLAGWMGRATEELADRLGHGVGGLLNATFGNAAELIIALIALSRGLTGVVKASIAGSIIGNVLLVMGVSILGGGIKFREQRFNQTAARASATTLTLAAFALTIPTVFHVTAAGHSGGWSSATEQKLSLAIAIVLFITYACLLGFELVTHKQLYVVDSSAEDETQGTDGWSVSKSLLVLIVATGLVALMSEFLVGAVEAARSTLGLTEVFVGVILIAVIGNAAEHSTAVMMAMKNKMGISLGIAVGSSLQIALFVAPVLVFASYFFGRPMDLEFTLPEVVAVIAAVHLIFQISGDGETNWLEGVQLLSVYLILVILFFYLPERTDAR
jgi:Ca2+:H+ antiporter